MDMNKIIAQDSLQQAQEPSEAEELAEAQAWGFDSAWALYAAYEAAYDEEEHLRALCDLYDSTDQLALQEAFDSKQEWNP